jgi:hypothetical protein
MQVYSRHLQFQHCGDLYTEEQTRRFLKEEIHQNGGIDKYMAKAKDKDDPLD